MTTMGSARVPTAEEIQNWWLRSNRALAPDIPALTDTEQLEMLDNAALWFHQGGTLEQMQTFLTIVMAFANRRHVSPLDVAHAVVTLRVISPAQADTFVSAALREAKTANTHTDGVNASNELRSLHERDAWFAFTLAENVEAAAAVMIRQARAVAAAKATIAAQRRPGSVILENRDDTTLLNLYTNFRRDVHIDLADEATYASDFAVRMMHLNDILTFFPRRNLQSFAYRVRAFSTAFTVLAMDNNWARDPLYNVQATFDTLLEHGVQFEVVPELSLGNAAVVDRLQATGEPQPPVAAAGPLTSALAAQETAAASRQTQQSFSNRPAMRAGRAPYPTPLETILESSASTAASSSSSELSSDLSGGAALDAEGGGEQQYAIGTAAPLNPPRGIYHPHVGVAAHPPGGGGGGGPPYGPPYGGGPPGGGFGGGGGPPYGGGFGGGGARALPGLGAVAAALRTKDPDPTYVSRLDPVDGLLADLFAAGNPDGSMLSYMM